jgi:hypothetical protein
MKRELSNTLARETQIAQVVKKGVEKYSEAAKTVQQRPLTSA